MAVKMPVFYSLLVWWICLAAIISIFTHDGFLLDCIELRYMGRCNLGDVEVVGCHMQNNGTALNFANTQSEWFFSVISSKFIFPPVCIINLQDTNLFYSKALVNHGPWWFIDFNKMPYFVARTVRYHGYDLSQYQQLLQLDTVQQQADSRFHQAE